MLKMKTGIFIGNYNSPLIIFSKFCVILMKKCKLILHLTRIFNLVFLLL